MKTVLIAAVLATTALAARAETMGYDFTYQGFSVWTPEHPDLVWSPETTLTGTVAGNDLNGDHKITYSELTKLIINGVDFKNCPADAYCTWEVADFGPGMSGFMLGADYKEPGPWDTSLYTRYRIFEGSSLTIEQSTDIYVFRAYRTDQTMLTAVPHVPEPSAYLMLGAGLVIAAAAARRRRP